MRNLPKALIVAALIPGLIFPRAARAAYEDLGVGARTTALGGAYTGVADDVYSIYYNPAGLGTLERPELSTSYARLLTGLSDGSNIQNSFLAYAHPLKQGEWGTYGLAWNYFTVDSLYRETMLFGSYGRALFPEKYPNTFYAGASLKYLNRSLGGVDAANNSIGPTGIATGNPDPVLQNTSRTNMDLDLGFLYRPKPRWTVGLAIQHFFEPNVAFSPADTDTLGRNLKLGGAYKTPFSTLASDVDFVKAPDGSTDKVLALAAEKWLPTLIHGTFGVRGSLAVGSRSYRQLAMGVSYKIHRLQFDYGFTMPLGGISGTFGTHRLGITFRFGRPRGAEPTYGEALLENMQELAKVGTPEFRYQMEDLALFKRTAIEEFLRQAKVDVGEGRFADGLDKLNQAASLKPGDPKIAASQERLKVVADIYPEVRDYATDASRAALYEGILEFLTGKDREAMSKVAYAQSLDQRDSRPEVLLQAIESKTGVPRAAQPAPPPAATPKTADQLVAGTMALVEVSLREREYDKVLKLAAQVIEIDPANALAYKRMGAAYYALKKHPEALKALRSALKLETDPEAKKSLASYIEALKALIERKSREEAAARANTAAPAPPSPQQIERLYEAGVELYAQGRFSEAAETFRKILEADPNNASARRALDRVQAETLQAPKR